MPKPPDDHAQVNTDLDTVLIPGSMSTGGKESIPDPSPTSATTDGHGGSSDRQISLSFLEPTDKPNRLGRLGTYDVVRVLGRGAFGIVLEAFDAKLERTVAIKVLSPSIAETPSANKRFLREARMAASVRHENVVHIYSVDENPVPYLVMEFIPGETIQHWVDQQGAIDLVDVLRLGLQVARGLEAAHSIGLIHRDIKPANILLDSTQSGATIARITDFGLARATDDGTGSQSGVVGTPMYMAPEQAQGEHVDQRADLFSLGSVLYFMITGSAPFSAPSTVAVLKKVAETTPKPINELVSTIPKSVCDVITKLHAKDADLRFQSAAELAAALDRCQVELISAPRTSPTKSKQQEPQPSRSVHPRDVVISALAILIAVPLLLFVIDSSNQQNPSSSRTESQIEKPASPSSSSIQQGTPVDLISRLNPSSMGDGRFEDLSVRDDILTLDATGASSQLWINFPLVVGKNMTIRTQLRGLDSQREGFAKLVFMPKGGAEYSALINYTSGTHRIWIERAGRPIGQQLGIELPQIVRKEWIDLSFTTSDDAYLVSVNGREVAKVARENHDPGHVAVSVSRWKCEMKSLQAIMATTN